MKHFSNLKNYYFISRAAIADFNDLQFTERAVVDANQ